jgi:hypothetical protein
MRAHALCCDGARVIGFILARGRTGAEAFDASERQPRCVPRADSNNEQAPRREKFAPARLQANRGE